MNEKCPACDGKGSLLVAGHEVGKAGAPWRRWTCQKCGGSGLLPAPPKD